MDDERAAEFDKPSSLLSREGGLFKSIVDASEKEGYCHNVWWGAKSL